MCSKILCPLVCSVVVAIGILFAAETTFSQGRTGDEAPHVKRIKPKPRQKPKTNRATKQPSIPAPPRNADPPKAIPHIRKRRTNPDKLRAKILGETGKPADAKSGSDTPTTDKIKIKPVPVDRDRALRYFKIGKEKLDKSDPEYGAAISNFDECIKYNPNFSEAYYNRARVKSAIGDQDGAMADYDRAIKIAPQYGGAYANRAGILLKKMNPEAAIKDATQALIFNCDKESYTCDNFAVIYTIRASAYKLIDDDVSALDDLGNAIKYDPNYAKAYFKRGQIYLDQKNYDAAISDCGKALEIDSATLGADQCKKDALAARGTYEDRIQKLAKKIDDASNDALGYYELGTAYLENQNFVEAIKKYGKAIDLYKKFVELNPKPYEPRLAYSYFNRGMAYFDSKDYDHAMDDYKEALTIDPNYRDVHCKKGLVYVAKKDLPAAISEFSASMKEGSDSTCGHYNRALAYIELKDYKNAEIDLTDFIDHSVKANPQKGFLRRAFVYEAMAQSASPDEVKALKEKADNDRKKAAALSSKSLSSN